MRGKTMLAIHGKPLDTKSESYGELRSSAGSIDDFDELRARFGADGYFYICPACSIATRWGPLGRRCWKP